MMKNIIETETKNRFVQYLTNKQNSAETEINISQLINEKVLKQHDKKSIKCLFELILSNQIELGKNKRFPYDFNIKLANNEKKNKEVSLSRCIELFDFYYEEISRQVDWSDFEKMTSYVFSKYAICQEIAKTKLSSPEIKILFKTIHGFLGGQHPVFLNDMQLKVEELIDCSLMLVDEQNPLIEHDLIRVQLDQDGVSIRTTITKKTLSIIGNLNPDANSHIPSTVKDTMFEVINCGDLEEVNLQYSESIHSVFNDFCALSQKIAKDEKLTMLLHGDPGTGKTEFAKQVAKNVNGKLYQLNFPHIQSKWIGETEKNIRRVFNAYQDAWQKSKSPIILLINEADGLMNKRVTVNTSNDSFANQAQTELLEQLENFEGILIATTNLLRNIDGAFHRRFLFKTEIHAPEVNIRNSYLKRSVIYPLLNASQIALINNTPYTIAEMKNIEQKIQLIQRIRKLSSKDIDTLFVHEGLVKNTTKAIGYDRN
jgi:ATP-dependent 26S proteasome regulatory subunit